MTNQFLCHGNERKKVFLDGEVERILLFEVHGDYRKKLASITKEAKREGKRIPSKNLPTSSMVKNDEEFALLYSSNPPNHEQISIEVTLFSSAPVLTYIYRMGERI